MGDTEATWTGARRSVNSSIKGCKRLSQKLMQVTATLNRGTAIAYERLGPAFSLPEDRVLSEPAESDSWNDIRRNVLFRIRIAAAGQALAESTVDEINDIATAIAAELNGR